MRKGLCQDCGQCCMTQESPPMYIAYLPGGVFEHEDSADGRRVKRLPVALVEELQAYKRNLQAGMKPPHPSHPACLWYDTAAKRCKHHALRPDMCRGFEVADEPCNRCRRQAGLVQLSVGATR